MALVVFLLGGVVGTWAVYALCTPVAALQYAVVSMIGFTAGSSAALLLYTVRNIRGR